MSDALIMDGRHRPLGSVHPIVRRMFEQRVKIGMSHEAWSNRSGLSTSTINNWRHCGEPTLGNADAALRALGLKLIVVPIGQAE